MKRLITSLIAAVILAVSLPASATSYAGWVRNWWVEENGDIQFYFLNETNTAYVTGLCGWGNYRLKVTNANYDVAYDSLKLAAKNSYKVLMEVVACDGQINVIKMVKVCTWTGDC